MNKDNSWNINEADWYNTPDKRREVNEAVMKELTDKIAEMVRLQAKIERYEAALRYYAGNHHLTNRVTTHGECIGKPSAYMRAQQALNDGDTDDV